MKNDKGDGFSWWDTVPIEAKTQDEFELEDILREFGGEGMADIGSEDDVPESSVPPVLRQFDRESGRDTPLSTHVAVADRQDVHQCDADGGKTIRFAPISQREHQSDIREPETDVMDIPEDLPVQGDPPSEPLDSAVRHHRPEDQVIRNSNYKCRKKKTAKPVASSPAQSKRKTAPTSAEARLRGAQEGMAGRTARMILCLLMAVLALIVGLIREQDMLESLSQQRFLVFGEMALLILCAICAWDVLVSGILRLRFDLNALVLVEVLLGLVHGFLCLGSGGVSYCPLICLVLFFALWGLQSRHRGIADTMDVARKTDCSSVLCAATGLSGDTTALLPGTDSLESFLNCHDRVPIPQRLTDIYALLTLLLSLVGAVLAPKGNMETFIRNWTVMLVAGTPLCGFLVWFRPWAALASRLRDKDVALYGWHGARKMGGEMIVPISDQDLFPGDSLKLNGVKFFGGASPERVIAYGAAVMEAVGGGLNQLFQAQLEQRGARRYTACKLRFYDSGGVGAEIMSDSVLVGTLRFMQAMGVDMPGGTKVSQAVYVAIEGELAGVFAIHYSVSRTIAESMALLCGCRGVVPAITALDFVITESFLRSKFRLDTARVLFPTMAQRLRWKELQVGANSEPCAMLRDYRLSAVALAVAGARALRTAVLWGAAVSFAGGFMGLGIVSALTQLGAQEVMSLANLALFQMIWAVPGLLLGSWPKNV